jgi:hypothetical protein
MRAPIFGKTMSNVETSQLVAMDGGIFETSWSVSNLDEIDREIVRLATICAVRLFDAEVLDRLLRNDASFCATGNPYAFKKLRGMVILYYSARMRRVHRLGDAHTTLLAQSLTERLRPFAGMIDSASQAMRSALPAGETST